MVTQKSGKFFVGSIITFLIIFGVIKMVLLTSQDAEKRVVKPVAQTFIGEAPVIVAAVEEESVGGGEQIVTQVCSMCHSSGMMSSPKLGSNSDWAPRIEKGIDTLYNHAINGFNMMPARGGRPDLSDDDVKAAVDHMLLLVK